MDIADAREFLRHNHHGVLVARKRDGSLQMTLVSPVVGDDDTVTITARALRRAAKVAPQDRTHARDADLYLGERQSRRRKAVK
jgi:hypothetical protein